jgi:hypothetical protein
MTIINEQAHGLKIEHNLLTRREPEVVVANYWPGIKSYANSLTSYEFIGFSTGDHTVAIWHIKPKN